MKSIQVIFRVLICAISLLVALGAASVENLWLMLGAGVLVCLVLPFTIIRSFLILFKVAFIVSAWRMLHIWFCRGSDYVSYGVVYVFVMSTFALILAYVKWRYLRFVLWVIGIFFVFDCAFYSRNFSSINDGDVAYLERGKWGISHSDSKELEIKSQYSYNIVKKCLSAKNISELDSLDEFSALWIMTPTQPFSAKEIKVVEEWVDAGGNLIVVSDHTDLFGHATVVNELLKPYEIEVGKDCIIEDCVNGVKYWSLVGWFRGLTGNTIQGKCNPFLLAWGYKERVDYSGRSFFSDNAVTDEDRFGVYCVGAYRAYGRGSVMVFSDSTLFADFSMSRPSAQMSFRMLRDGAFVYNIPFFLIVLCGLYFVSRMKKINLGLRFVILLCSVSAGFIYIVRCVNSEMELPLGCDIKTVKTIGNWDLVDDDNATYSVLFAANYATDAPIPEWEPLPLHSGNIEYNRIVLPRTMEGMSELRECDLNGALTNSVSRTADEFLRDLCISSRYEGIWFDYGVGIAKRIAYKNFWGSLYSLPKQSFEICRTKVMRGEFFINGVKHDAICFPCAEINDSNEWVVVGDWMIGRCVGEEILIREKWQHHRRQFGDIVLVPINKQE